MYTCGDPVTDEALPVAPQDVSVDECLSQAIECHQNWKFDEAYALYHQVLSVEPTHADTNHNLGVLLAIQMLRPQEALPYFEVALNADAQSVQYWFSYIDALIRAGQSDMARQLLPLAQAQGLQTTMVNALAERLEKPVPPKPATAVQSVEQALAPAPCGPSHDEMVAIVALFNNGDYAKGEVLARGLVERMPESGFAWKALGTMLQAQGNQEEGLLCKQKAVQFMPKDAEAWCNLGRSYFELSQTAKAIGALQTAIALRPDHAESHNNLGLAFNAEGFIQKAHESLLKAVELKPDYAEALNNLSGTFNTLGEIDKAAAVLRRAIASKPDNRVAFDNLLFVLNYHADKSGEEIYETYREYEKRFGAPYRSEWLAHENNRDVKRRLKVGYVSPDFRNHSCTFFMEPLLSHHDRGEVEVYAYADLAQEDAATARYKSYVEHWIPTRGMTDAALAQRIRADGIDILVDMAGHTAGNRLGVFARKPAPVSLSWMGYGYTTGLRAIDYYLTDEASVPVGQEHLFSEEPWRLKDSPYAVYRPPQHMVDIDVAASPLPALRNGYITLGTLTRGVRINHRTVRVWTDILKRLPEAHLVVDSSSFKDPAIQEVTIQRFEACGIERARLHIGFNSPATAVLQGMDIGLDCFPHNSGTTLFESLYMGVPYVTLAGRASVGRIGSAILQGLGRPEWIATSEQEYIDKVVALAQDTQALQHHRNHLRQEMQSSRLMDEAGFTSRVEQAYRDMFSRWGATPSAPVRETQSSGKRSKAKPVQSVPSKTPTTDEMRVLASFFETRDFAAGETTARKLIAKYPNHGFAWKALGALLHPLGRTEEALEAKRKAAKLLPKDAEALCNFGQSLQDAGHFGEAESVLGQALALKPHYAEAHNNLAITFQKTGRLDVAIPQFLAALALQPDNKGMFSNYLFTLNYHADKSGEEIYETYREYEKRFGAPYRSEWLAHENNRDVKRRLKVGYVSPDFRNHSCTFFMEPLLSHHDRGEVEVYAYADLAQEDAATARYKSYVEHWIPTRGMTDAALAQRIRADGIDILVDMAGHTAGNRLGVFARKPAPVSLSWMGYGYTTGLRAIDYYLTDEASVPVGQEHLFSEEPWRLKDSPYAVYRPPQHMVDIDVAASPLPALRNGYITLGTLTRGVRINHRTVRVWTDILKRLPEAHLVVDSSSFKDPAIQEVTIQRFEACGIERARLHIGFNSPATAVLQGMDIGLDCFPHNSGTTLFESLYMGVPYVTLAGRASVGRIGSAILQGLGRPEWIATSEQEYIDKVVALAQDTQALQHHRNHLRQEMQSSRLMDEAGFTSRVEQAYRDMFSRWVFNTSSGDVEANPSAEALGAVLELYNEGKFEEAANIALSLTGRYSRNGYSWKLYGSCLQKLGRESDALVAKRRAVQLLPDDVEALFNLALTYEQQEMMPEAERCYRSVIEKIPDDVEALHNLGNTLLAQGQRDGAVKRYQEALAIQPDFLPGLKILGTLLQEAGSFVESESVWRRVLKLEPGNFDTAVKLGRSLLWQGRRAEAEVVFRQATDVSQETYVGYFQRANLLAEVGKYIEAEADFRRALEIEPKAVEVWCNLCSNLKQQNRYVDAELCAREALKINPELPTIVNNLAVTLLMQGQLEEAIAGFEKVARLDPALTMEGLLFSNNYHADKSGEEIYETYREYEKRFGAPYRSEWLAHENNRDVKRRLKVGYVSPDFRNHSCTFFMEPLLSHHDRGEVEVYAYADLAQEDAATARYKSYVEHWIPTRGMTDAALAQRIRADGIDILVDMAGHTAGNRLGVFARKPAPVSLSWMGYGYTTGLRAIDYYLTDEASVPVGQEHLFSEEPWRLKDSPYAVYRPPQHMVDIDVAASPLPALRNGYITLGTLTRGVRINHRTVRVWTDILKRLPEAHLVVDSSSFKDPAIQEVTIQRFEACGIERARLHIGFNSPATAVLQGMDIGLDCFPHNSGTTLFESLYMGVPYVTLAGRASVGRIGSAILQGLGRPEWIATSEQEYIDKVVALAQDTQALQHHRNHLRQEMQSSRLMDEAGFTSRVEQAYRDMFSRWIERHGAFIR